MRGKLRDKRIEAKRDKFRRELLERRRGGKRENRSAVALAWQNQLLELEEEHFEDPLEDDEETSRFIRTFTK